MGRVVKRLAASLEVAGRDNGFSGKRRREDRTGRGGPVPAVGGSDVFDQAFAHFAAAYAVQNERDYKSLLAAISSGRIAAEHGL